MRDVNNRFTSQPRTRRNQTRHVNHGTHSSLVVKLSPQYGGGRPPHP